MLDTFKLFKLESWPDPAPAIPDTVRHLELMACPGLTSTACFDHLRRLEVLHLGLCPDLVDISLRPFPQLKELSLLDLPIAVFDELSSAPLLHSAYLGGLSQLTRVGHTGQQGGLRSLNISRCEQLWDISGLEQLAGLEQLTLARLPRIGDLGVLAGLKSLVSLVLDRCPGISSIASAVRLPALRSVTIHRCPAIEDLDLWGARSDVTVVVS